MDGERIKVFVVVCVCLLLLEGRASMSPVLATPNPDEAAPRPEVYLIQLSEPPLATYHGGIADLPATSLRSTGAHKLNVYTEESKRYRTYLAKRQQQLHQAAEQRVGHAIPVIYHYNIVFNGLALLLTAQEAAQLAHLRGVINIQKDYLRRPLYDSAYVTTVDSATDKATGRANDSIPAFLQAPSIWNGTATGPHPGTKGEGVIVGVIDSGIWPEHPSFADDGAYPPPPVWYGECKAPADTSPAYTCNNKLIGIQYFLDAYAMLGDYEGLFYSGRDDSGHGTHTASTAAGNENAPVTLYNIPRGTVSGVAPRAYLASYKAVGPYGGMRADLTAAIEKAVADGVDVINYSLGSSYARDPWRAADAQAFLAAMEAGIFVVTAVGNDGPAAGTVGAPANAPWVTSVGASYADRLYLSELTLRASSGARLTGLYGASITPGITNFRLVSGQVLTDSKGNTGEACTAPFSPDSFQKTDAVLCRGGMITPLAMSDFVRAGGAGAVLIYSAKQAYDQRADLQSIPTVQLPAPAGQAVQQFLAAHPQESITVSFTEGHPVFAPDARVPVDTIFSSSARGPTVNESTKRYIDVIKPDLTAPGVHILAGASPHYVSTVHDQIGQYGAQEQLFKVAQGTSMASPHVAGAAALLIALHPEWTPSQLRSALMTASRTVGQQARGPDGDYPATAFDQGAGRLDVARAARAGLVLDETAERFAAANPARGGDPATLNLASLTAADCHKSCTWTRTVQSTLPVAVMWTVNVTAGPQLKLSVIPTTFTLAAGASHTITITADVRELSSGVWAFGQLQLTPDNSATVEAHLPVAVRSSS